MVGRPRDQTSGDPASSAARGHDDLVDLAPRSGVAVRRLPALALSGHRIAEKDGIDLGEPGVGGLLTEAVAKPPRDVLVRHRLEHLGVSLDVQGVHLRLEWGERLDVGQGDTPNGDHGRLRPAAAQAEVELVVVVDVAAVVVAVAVVAVVAAAFVVAVLLMPMLLLRWMMLLRLMSIQGKLYGEHLWKVLDLTIRLYLQTVKFF